MGERRAGEKSRGIEEVFCFDRKEGGFMAYELVKIFTAQDNLQAEMILEALKENDIPAMKKDLGNAEVLNLYGANSGCGEEIYVGDENAQKAQEVLAGMGLDGL